MGGGHNEIRMLSLREHMFFAQVIFGFVFLLGGGRGKFCVDASLLQARLQCQNCYVMHLNECTRNVSAYIVTAIVFSSGVLAAVDGLLT